jgi:tRNA threonylcarbamoyl adenosine modification protein YeaZ
VAVVEDGRTIGEVILDTRRSRTEKLLVVLQRLLADLDLRVCDLDRIGFSEGPGSFTGLRVGMAAALGLAAGCDCPLVAVPSLEVLAYPWRGHGDAIAVATGLRRGHLYFGAYRWNGERLEAIHAPSNPTAEQMLDLIGATPVERFLFAGDALDSLAGEIRARVGSRAWFMPPVPARAADVAALASDSLRPAWTGQDREGHTPSYLRDADARKPRHRA